MIDYVLTVSVSTVAGVDAIVSAVPSLFDFKVEIAIIFVSFVALANLRGLKESGTFFAVPTYGFLLSIGILIASGLIQCVGGCPAAESADLDIHPEQALTLFLILRAFAAGTTALTGVEAISDGVPSFRYPQSKNAATTLTIMAGISVSMFIGITYLATRTGVRYVEELEDQKTVIAQIADAVFSGGPMFYVVQVMTAAILFLAANTAFADFPRLSSILAQDRFMPRQFMNRGDRLVFSNGIIILAVLASLLIVIFDAQLSRLIQLYLVGVFVSFTLSQTGMIRHWLRTREKGWRHSLVINAFGAALTGVVLIVVVLTKFTHGAYIVVGAIPVVMFAMHSIHRHYEEVGKQLAHPGRRPAERRPSHQHMVIVIDRVDAAAARAIGYVRAIRPTSATAVTFDTGCFGAWNRLAPDIPLTNAPRGNSRTGRLKNHLRELRSEMGNDDFLTVVVPEILESRSMYEVFRHPAMHTLKAALLTEPGVQVLDIPLLKNEIDPNVDQAHEPARNYAIVLVSGVNNAALQAIEYAETLRPTDLRAVSFGFDSKEQIRLGNKWMEHAVPHPLEIEDSPFRDIGRSLTEYLHQFKPDGVNRVVTVVIPEFVVSKRRHQILHGQTALLVKSRLLFEKGVVAVSVPYHLEEKLHARTSVRGGRAR